MKQNNTLKVLKAGLAALVLLVTLLTIKTINQQKKDNDIITTVEPYKFCWNAGVNAPRGYEMQIMATYVFGNNSCNTFTISENRKANGWGSGAGIGDHNDHIHLPTEVLVNSLSKTEGKYYKTTVKIDTVKVRQLVAKGCGIDKYTNKPIVYTLISVGAAPGGVAAVWLQSPNNNHMIGWAKGIEDPNPPQLGYLDFRKVVKLHKEKPFYGGLWEGEYSDEKKVSFEMGDESINCVTKNGIPLGSWDYYPKQYDWQPVVLSNKEYQVVDFLFALYTVTGGRDDLGSAKYVTSSEPSLPVSYNWKEVEKSNYFKNVRGIPNFVGLEWVFNTNNIRDGAQIKVMLPVKKIYGYFESGFTKSDGIKGNYNKIVFEVNKQKKVKIWLFGDIQHKIKLLEYQSDEKEGQGL